MAAAGRRRAPSHLPVWAAICVALLAQLATSSHLRPLRPAVDELPFPPTKLAMEAFALGDDQFLFRALVSWLQDFGDGGGRLLPLGQYDYHRVVDWLRAVDSLDPESNAVFSLGSTYFGAISDPATAKPRLKLLTQYFKEAGASDLDHRWTWLVWALIKIQHNVDDPALARQAAEEMLTLKPDAKSPYYWLPLMAIPLYRAAGDTETAKALDRREDMVALRQRGFRELNSNLYGDSQSQP